MRDGSREPVGPVAGRWRSLGSLLRRDLAPYADHPHLALWRLLHEGDPVPAADLPLAADTVRAAADLGVLVAVGDHLRSTVSVLPVDLGGGPAWVACDFVWAEDLPGAAGTHVGGPGTATFTLAAAVPPLGGGVTRVVDAGTGCGALAVLLARRFPGATVHAGDVNPRALHLTALTSGLSDTPVVPVLDDLRAPPAGPTGADLAVCNAPYVLGAPDNPSTFRDAVDDDQTRVLAEGLLARVRDGGLTLSTSSWAHRDGRDAAADLVDALAVSGRDVLVVERAVVTPERYAALWAGDDPDRERRWAAGLRERGVTAVGAGLLAVRAGGSGGSGQVVRVLDERGPGPGDVVAAWWADVDG